jgi:hypothetical protein
MQKPYRSLTIIPGKGEPISAGQPEDLDVTILNGANGTPPGRPVTTPPGAT